MPNYTAVVYFLFAGEVLWQKGPIFEGIVFGPESVTVSEDGRVIVPDSFNKQVVTLYPDIDGYYVVSVSNRNNLRSIHIDRKHKHGFR